MSRALVLYGTTDGHTAKVASVLATTLREAGCPADAVNAAAVPRGLRVEDYDAVIVAASVHVGGYQRPVTRWVRANAAALNRKPGAFVSVCLGILERRPEARAELDRILARFLARTAWHPAATRLVAGALPWSRYGWFKTWVMRRIVAKAGGDTDTSRDREYTDWQDLRQFARELAAAYALGPAEAAPAAAPGPA